MSTQSGPLPAGVARGANQTIREAALLIDCLRGAPVDVPPDADWHALLRLSRIHGILQLTQKRLAATGIPVPEFFQTAARDARNEAEQLAIHLQILLGHFDQSGIDVLPLKGPALALALYGDAALRSCDDLDLLVRPADFARAGSLLLRIGFAVRNGADDYHRKYARAGLLVELHFELASPRSLPLDAQGVWSRARASSFRSRPMRAMASADLVLFLALHGWKHGFSRLIWVSDLACSLHQIEDAGELFSAARRQGLEQALLIACEMARETMGTLPPGVQAAVAESPRAAALARRAVERLLAEPPRTRHDPELWSLYLWAESGAGQRWRRRFRYFEPTFEDYRWAGRNGIPRALAPLLRPIRLLGKYGPVRAWRTLFPPPL